MFFPCFVEERPKVLLILNTWFHFELVLPWCAFLLRVGCRVEITGQFILSAPDRIQRIKDVFVDQPVTILPDIVVSRHVETGEIVTTGLRTTQYLTWEKDGNPNRYKALVLLSYYPHWPVPFLPAEKHKTPFFLVTHTTSRHPWNPEISLPHPHWEYIVVRNIPWGYIPTSHGPRVDQVVTIPPWCITMLGTSQQAYDRVEAWTSTRERRILVQGRLMITHRAYRLLLDALSLLDDGVRRRLKILLMGSRCPSSGSVDHLLARYPAEVRAVVEVVPDRNEQEFSRIMTTFPHVLLDAVDRTIIHRERYAVDRMTSTFSWSAFHAIPVLTHSVLASRYSPHVLLQYDDHIHNVVSMFQTLVDLPDAVYVEAVERIVNATLAVEDSNHAVLQGIMRPEGEEPAEHSGSS